MATALRTPGVYIEEKNAFPNSVVEVPTAVPAFVGYTEFARNGSKSLINVPFRITSLGEYHQHFGGGAYMTYKIEDPDTDEASDFSADGKDYALHQDFGKFNLYRSMRLFFDNGGGPCFIVAVGTYGLDALTSNFVDAASLLSKLNSENDSLIKITTLPATPTPEAIEKAVAAAAKILPGYAQHIEQFAGDGAEPGAADKAVADCDTDPFKTIDDVATLKANVDAADKAVFGKVGDINTALTKFADPKTVTAADVTALNTAVTAVSAAVKTGAASANTLLDAARKKVAPTLTVKGSALQNGIDQLVRESEPTMLVLPDLMSIEKDDVYSIQQYMLDHCGNKMKSRVALLDIYNGWLRRDDPNGDPVAGFRNGVASDFLKFGAAYYPWLYTTIVQSSEIDYRNIANISVAVSLLKAEVSANLKANLISPAKAKELNDLIAGMTVTDGSVNAFNLNNTLLSVSPRYNSLMTELRKKMNLLPPSGAMAGIYTRVDNARGVWKAPANVAVASTISPSVNITHDDQEDLNVTLQGKSVNAIRSFIGEGVLVWGARTLDGNSQDWRYVNVRRTMIMLEQSIRIAAKAYVFEPNDAKTWVSIKGMINNYLTSKWKEGALVGAKPEDAFDVQVGLGSTMTANDILDGIMNITVLVAISRPAEFIVITFQQQMQKS